MSSYPWRLGATSFVLPAGVEENVRFLAPQVDDVQLLFFESASRARLPHEVDVPLLGQLAAEHELSYTVHLPTDLALGSQDDKRRHADVVEVCRLVEQLASLQPLAFDLHLNREEELPELLWLEGVQRSLAELAQQLGHWQQRLCIENISYPLSAELVALVAGSGASWCLDLGHLCHYGHAMTWPEQGCGHVHLHGVADGRDHQPLEQEPWLLGVVEMLKKEEFGQVLTLEVYNEGAWRQSCQALAWAWQQLSGG